MVQDIHNARKHNFKIAVITEGWQSEERLKKNNPDYLVQSFKELKNVL